mmetsp:Transcript_38466/g.89974  ORF Transcript_38466/g.89974 Transcript_38466/m.89974 type:complete len:406 (-) Transcript_38466:369-1586(-)
MPPSSSSAAPSGPRPARRPTRLPARSSAAPTSNRPGRLPGRSSAAPTRRRMRVTRALAPPLVAPHVAAAGPRARIDGATAARALFSGKSACGSCEALAPRRGRAAGPLWGVASSCSSSISSSLLSRSACRSAPPLVDRYRPSSLRGRLEGGDEDGGRSTRARHVHEPRSLGILPVLPADDSPPSGSLPSRRRPSRKRLDNDAAGSGSCCSCSCSCSLLVASPRRRRWANPALTLAPSSAASSATLASSRSLTCRSELRELLPGWTSALATELAASTRMRWGCGRTALEPMLKRDGEAGVTLEARRERQRLMQQTMVLMSGSAYARQRRSASMAIGPCKGSVWEVSMAIGQCADAAAGWAPPVCLAGSCAAACGGRRLAQPTHQSKSASSSLRERTSARACASATP